MSEMVERVARALCRYAWERHIKHKNLDAYIDDHWHHHAAGARIMIEAMKEPTDHMMFEAVAACNFSQYFTARSAKDCWGVMIDAALEPKRDPSAYRLDGTQNWQG